MRRKRTNALLLSLSAALSLAVAGQAVAAEAASGEAGSEATGSNVVATVNGEPITETMVQQYTAQRGERRPKLNREQVINELVTQELLAQAAKKDGLDERPEIAASVQNTVRNILARAAVQRHMKDNPVSDETLRQAYDSQSDKMSGGKEYKARHILLEDKATAETVIGELDEGGDFAALAKEHSTGPSAEKGGSLGWVKADSTVESFAEALSDMEVGTYTKDPVETRFGWHVIKLEDTRQAEAPSYEEVKGRLRQVLQRQAVQGYLQELRSAADIEVKGSTDSTAPDTGPAGSE